MDPCLSKALSAFLALTSDQGEKKLVLQALVLHMLEAHAPATFQALRCQTPLEGALLELQKLSKDFAPGLDPDLAMAQIDALYILWQRQMPWEAPALLSLRRYLDWLGREDFAFHRWLLSEMSLQMQIPVRPYRPDRPYREDSRMADLYWMTHILLLDSGFLQRPLPPGHAPEIREELLLAGDFLREAMHVDLAGEVAIGLTQLKADTEPAAEELVEFLRAQQRSDGSFADTSIDEDLDAEEMTDHCTGVALVALAGFLERKES